MLSQYRRKIFERNRQHIKPVILFKSKTIKDSQAFLEEFKEAVKKLKAESLEAIKSRSSEPVVLKILSTWRPTKSALRI